MGAVATRKRLYPCAVKWCAAMTPIPGGWCLVHSQPEYREYQPTDEQSSVPKCCKCSGTGECKTCDGDGKCNACKGDCPDCIWGDGKCKACNGTGKHAKVQK
jgi:hypothetical protein